MANPIRLLIVEDNADLSANLAEFFLIVMHIF